MADHQASIRASPRPCRASAALSLGIIGLELRSRSRWRAARRGQPRTLRGGDKDRVDVFVLEQPRPGAWRWPRPRALNTGSSPGAFSHVADDVDGRDCGHRFDHCHWRARRGLRSAAGKERQCGDERDQVTHRPTLPRPASTCNRAAPSASTCRSRARRLSAPPPMSDKDPKLVRANRPVLALHVPEPKFRPGDTPDFSNLAIPAGGRAAASRQRGRRRPKPRRSRPHLVRVLDDDHRAVGPWDPKLDADTLRKMLQRHGHGAGVRRPHVPRAAAGEDQLLHEVHRRGGDRDCRGQSRWTARTCTSRPIASRACSSRAAIRW